MNRCPCGYANDPVKACAPATVTKYQKRISSSMLDRIDTALPHRTPARRLR
jgi:predicted ATPase with chaperone activity